MKRLQLVRNEMKNFYSSITFYSKSKLCIRDNIISYKQLTRDLYLLKVLIRLYRLLFIQNDNDYHAPSFREHQD